MFYGSKKRKYGPTSSIRRSPNIGPYSTSAGKSATQHPDAYAKALLDPENNSSCIIPDLNTFPTVTYSSSTSFQIPVVSPGGSNIAGVYVSLTPNPSDTLYFESASSTNSLYALTTAQPITGAASMVATYRSARIVAASLRIEHCGNDNLNEGIVIGTSYANSIVDGIVTSIGAQQNCRNTYVGPAKNGCIITYRPVDGSNFDMKPLNDVAYKYGYLQVHLNGIATTANIQGHLTIHYEGITLTTSDVEFAKIYCAPTAFQATISLVADTKPVGSGDTAGKKQVADVAKSKGNEVTTQTNALDMLVTGGLEAAIKYGPTLLKGYQAYQSMNPKSY